MRTYDVPVEMAYIKKTSEGCWMIRATTFLGIDCEQLETELRAQFGAIVAAFLVFETDPPVIDVRLSSECTEEQAEAMREQISAFGENSSGDLRWNPSVTVHRVSPSTSYEWRWINSGLTSDIYQAVGVEGPLLTRLRLRNDTGEAVTNVIVPRRGDVLKIQGMGVFDIRNPWVSLPKVDMASGETVELESIYLPTSMRRGDLPRGLLNSLQ
jgi:hypothetical protein